MDKGLDLAEKGKYKESIGCFEKAIKLDPNSYGGWINKGMSLKNLGEKKEAINCFNQAVIINPSQVLAWINMGKTFLEIDDAKNALKCLNKALELDNNNPETWNDKGRANILLNKYDEALNCYNEAIELDNSYYPAINDAGLVYLNKGMDTLVEEDFVNAKMLFKRANEINPAFYSLKNLGIASFYLGEYDKSLEYLNNSFKLEKNDIGVKFYTILNKGINYILMNEYQKAMNCFDQAYKIDNSVIIPIFSAGRVFANKKDFYTAKILFMKAVEIKPDFLCLKHLGLTLFLNEDYDEALEYLNKAFNLKNNDPDVNECLEILKNR